MQDIQTLGRSHH